VLTALVRSTSAPDLRRALPAAGSPGLSDLRRALTMVVLLPTCEFSSLPLAPAGALPDRAAGAPPPLALHRGRGCMCKPEGCSGANPADATFDQIEFSARYAR
jgi:hypothetical protein